MNKAFIREPDDDGKVYCPRCGALGRSVTAGPLDTHISSESRQKIGDAGWFCSYPPCDVVYFDPLERMITVDELNGPVYPKDSQAPLCACFGVTLEDIEADVAEGTPTRIRELLKKSESEAARCQSLAADGRNCMAEVRRIYMKLRGQQ